jgi:hypothetical protein
MRLSPLAIAALLTAGCANTAAIASSRLAVSPRPALVETDASIASGVAASSDASLDPVAADAAPANPLSDSLRAQLVQWLAEASRRSERTLSLVRASDARAVSWERDVYIIDCTVRDEASGYERSYRALATLRFGHVPALRSWQERSEFSVTSASDFALAAAQSWFERHPDILAVHATDPRTHPRLLAYRTAAESTVCVSSQPAQAIPFATCWAEPGMVDRLEPNAFEFARGSDSIGEVRYDAPMPDGRVTRVRVFLDERGRARMARGRGAPAPIATTAYPETGPLALLVARTQPMSSAGRITVDWSTETQQLRCERTDQWRCPSAPTPR